MGAEVHGVSRRQREPCVDGPSRWWKSDIENVDEARALWDAVKPDVIYHMSGAVNGAPDLELLLPCFRSILSSTVNLLSVAASSGCRRIVLSSSLEDEDGPESDGVPASPYAAAKMAALQYSRMCYSVFGVPVVLLRPFMGYGPGQPTWKVIPSAVSALLKGEPPVLSSGQRELDWIFVDDITDAYVNAGFAAGIEGKTFDIGTGKLTSIREVVNHLVSLLNSSVQPQFGQMPDRPLRSARRADTAHTETLLGWRPKTPLEEGLRRTVEYLSELGPPSDVQHCRSRRPTVDSDQPVDA